MRLCLVSQEYPPETADGGIGSQTYTKAHGLATRGHDVHVISGSIDDEERQYIDGLVHVTRIPGFRHRLPLNTEPVQWLAYSLAAASSVSELHSQEPFDIVEFPEYGCEGYTHLLNRTEWNHIPTVIQLHGPLVMFAHTLGWPEIDSEFYRTGTMMEGTCLRLADAVYSSSGCSADWCAAHYGLERNAIPVMHTGVDCRTFYPREVSKDDRPRIIFVGRIHPDKGVHLLLEAACILAKELPGLRLQMLGRGEPDLVDELRNKALAAGLPDLLDLPGFVSRPELPNYLARSQVFAAPSAYEGGPGFVYLEAMACGLPVIACAGSGAAEVVQHGERGLLVPPEDRDSLVQALHHLLSDAPSREAMGARAREYVLAEADSEICLRRIEAFYSAVAVGRPCAAEARA